jgi:hypothetical protein
MASLTFTLPGFATASGEIDVKLLLLTPVSSYYTKSGSEVRALMTMPVCGPDGALLSDGATFRGSVKHVHKVGLGIFHETARLEFEFDELHLSDGRTYPIETRLLAIQNARERVDKHGSVHGIRATAVLSNRFGQHLVFAAMNHPAAMIPLFALENGLFRFPEPEIDYEPGTEFRLAVRFPEVLGQMQSCAVPPSAKPAGLDTLVARLPAWSFSLRQPQAMDPVNLVFVGSADELHAAFAAAGWSGVRPNSLSAGLTAIRAVVEERPFLQAPMRTLLVDGAPPDLRLQKSLNTFEKRDHLRVWKRPETWENRDLWVSAATRDIAVTFSVRPFGFTHEIQSDVDLERDEVIGDLQFTGCVDSVAYIDRTDAQSRNVRKGLTTDGRVAVVVLNACREPRLSPAVAPPVLQPPLAVRCVRRATLTARNHLIRDNIVWRTGDALRIGIETLRHWTAAHKMS